MINAREDRAAMESRVYRCPHTGQWWLSWRGFVFHGSRHHVDPTTPHETFRRISSTASASESVYQALEEWTYIAQGVIIRRHQFAPHRFEPRVIWSIHDTAAYAAAHDAYWAMKPKYWTELYDLLTVQRGTYGT